MNRIIIALLLGAVATASGAAVDGKWKLEAQEAAKPRTNKKGAAAKKAEATLDLKTSGSQLTGSVIASSGKRARPVAISDGKIEGDKFTFTTVQKKTKKGDAKLTWTGTVKGDEITGTRTREGGRRGQPFTAKRQS